MDLISPRYAAFEPIIAINGLHAIHKFDSAKLGPKMGSVLPQAAEADFHHAELPLDHPERVFHLCPDARLAVLR